jgi:hypothetical protein
MLNVRLSGAARTTIVWYLTSEQPRHGVCKDVRSLRDCVYSTTRSGNCQFFIFTKPVHLAVSEYGDFKNFSVQKNQQLFNAGFGDQERVRLGFLDQSVAHFAGLAPGLPSCNVRCGQRK